MIAPSVTINMVTSTIVLKIYDFPFVMTGGGPPGHATETLAITIYNNFFSTNKIHGHNNLVKSAGQLLLMEHSI